MTPRARSPRRGCAARFACRLPVAPRRFVPCSRHDLRPSARKCGHRRPRSQPRRVPGGEAAVGRRRSALVASPSCPEPLFPQHLVLPALVTAQLWDRPCGDRHHSTRELGQSGRPGASPRRAVAELAPAGAAQHLTAPPRIRAQACWPPAVIAVTPLVSPETGTGWVRAVARAVTELAVGVVAPALDCARPREGAGVSASDRDGYRAAGKAGTTETGVVRSLF